MSTKNYVIARLELRGHKFEIIVHPDKALQFKEGNKRISIDDVLIGDYIYKDVRKGLKASPEELRQLFGVADYKKVAEQILRKGELQLTTEQRRKLLEAKRRQIVMFISKSAIDPRTKTPIPPQRIEKAMDEARVAVDLYKSIEEQATHIIKAISRYLPIKIATAYITIKVSPEIAARAYSELRRLGNLKGEKWLSDGSLKVEVEVPAGMQAEVIDKVNRLTKGTAEITVKVI
jgi:ribosome maturation protein SDO1